MHVGRVESFRTVWRLVMATGDRPVGPASGDGEFDDNASGIDQRLSDLLAPLIDDLIPSYSPDRAVTPDLRPPCPDDLSAATTSLRHRLADVRKADAAEAGRAVTTRSNDPRLRT